MELALNSNNDLIDCDFRYGMGMIYYKQERYSMAEFYFRKALDINQHSPVLKCHVAIVEHALQRTDKALQMLNSALALETRNPLCKFHRASIYFACDRLDEALVELHQLKEIAPREALVYYLMGNVSTLFIHLICPFLWLMIHSSICHLIGTNFDKNLGNVWIYPNLGLKGQKLCQ